jgi:tetratricopeptide (TPR) repeat protein
MDELPSPATTFAIGVEVKRFLDPKLCGCALLVSLTFLICDVRQALAEKGDKVATVAKPADAKSADAGEPPAQNDKKPYSKEAVEHYNRGLDLHQSGFINQAVAEYKAAIEADPRMEEAYSNLGVIYAAQHSYPKAKEAFLAALKIRPNRPTTLNGLGTVLYAQKKFEEAKDKWLQAVTIDPNFASAFYNIGNACESEGKFEEAKTYFDRALKVSPNMADAYYRLGVIMYKQRHYAQSGALLRRAVLFAPEGDFIHDARRLLQNIDRELERGEATVKESRNQPQKAARSAGAGSEKEKTNDTAGDGNAKSPVHMFIQPGQDKDTSENSSK